MLHINITYMNDILCWQNKAGSIYSTLFLRRVSLGKLLSDLNMEFINIIKRFFLTL